MNGNIYDYPHFLLLNHVTSRIGVPLLFLLVYHHVTKNKISWIHLLHTIPLFLFLVNFKEVLFASAEDKENIMRMMETHGYSYIWDKGILFSAFWVEIVRVVPFVFYVFFIGWMIFNFRKSLDMPPYLISFFKLVFWFLLANLVPIILASFGSEWMDKYLVSNVVGLVSTLIILIAFFFLPDFLYGEAALKKKLGEGDKYYDQEYSGVNFESKIPKLITRIEDYLEESRSHLDTEFQLRIIERDLGISGRYISEAIKDHYSMNFNQFINKKRMEFFKKEYVKCPTIINKSIDTIAQELGYKSVNNFYVQVKEAFGVTPKEYIDSMRLKNDSH